MPFTKEEIQELIDFEKATLQSIVAAAEMIGGGEIVGTAVKIQKDRKAKVIKALEEYRDIINVKNMLDESEGDLNK
jgi:hypothetical protein